MEKERNPSIINNLERCVHFLSAEKMIKGEIWIVNPHFCDFYCWGDNKSCENYKAKNPLYEEKARDYSGKKEENEILENFEQCIWRDTEAWLEGEIDADDCEECSGVDEECEDYCSFDDYFTDEIDEEWYAKEEDELNYRPKTITIKDVEDYLKRKKRQEDSH